MSGLRDSVESMNQFATAWHALVLDREPAADVRNLPGIAVRWADSPNPTLNVMTMTEIGVGLPLLEQRLNEAAKIMREKSFPGHLWLFEDLLDGEARSVLDEVAARAGLECQFSCVGMAGDFLPIPEPVHPDLEFVRATSDEHLRAFSEIVAASYGVSGEDAREGLTGSRLWAERVIAFLGLDGGVPVTCAAVIEVDGRLFVPFVSTRPERDRRGYGEAVTRKALHEANKATGVGRATLHSTEAGERVYTRIGFRPNSRVRILGLKG